jgi:hypothetical protein
MSLTKYLHALKWEFLQNLPLILGFLAAARLWRQSFLLALVVLIAGIGGGILLMHYTEPFLHKEKYPPTWGGPDQPGLFVVIALPSVLLFHGEQMDQLEDDPWQGVASCSPWGDDRLKGKRMVLHGSHGGVFSADYDRVEACAQGRSRSGCWGRIWITLLASVIR